MLYLFNLSDGSKIELLQQWTSIVGFYRRFTCPWINFYLINKVTKNTDFGKAARPGSGERGVETARKYEWNSSGGQRPTRGVTCPKVSATSDESDRTETSMPRTESVTSLGFEFCRNVCAGLRTIVVEACDDHSESMRSLPARWRRWYFARESRALLVYLWIRVAVAFSSRRSRVIARSPSMSGPHGSQRVLQLPSFPFSIQDEVFGAKRNSSRSLIKTYNGIN